MAVTLIFIRHGESESNYEHRFTGQLDTYGLTERGHIQAQITANVLSDIKIDAVISSDLRRASDTVNHIADMHGLKIITDTGFREIYAGQWEGELFDVLPKLYPNEFGVWLKDIGSAVCTGGESVAELQTRVKAAVENIVRNYSGKTVVIGTHATPIRVMQCIWQNIPLSGMKNIPWVPNASITSVVYENEDTWRDVVIGQTAHLTGYETVLPQNV